MNKQKAKTFRTTLQLFCARLNGEPVIKPWERPFATQIRPERVSTEIDYLFYKIELKDDHPPERPHGSPKDPPQSSPQDTPQDFPQDPPQDP